MRLKYLAAGLAALCAAAGVAEAQVAPRNTLVLLRQIDADRYDPPRSTARPPFPCRRSADSARASRSAVR